MYGRIGEHILKGRHHYEGESRVDMELPMYEFEV